MIDAEAWVAVAFVIFIGGLGYLGVHRKLIGALDERATRIRTELDEASRLRDEARALLIEYQRKHDEIKIEAQNIVAAAHAESGRLADEIAARMNDFIARRTRMVEAKIVQAEAKALRDVRSVAADVSIAAAEELLKQSAKCDNAATMSRCIRSLGTHNWNSGLSKDRSYRQQG